MRYESGNLAYEVKKEKKKISAKQKGKAIKARANKRIREQAGIRHKILRAIGAVVLIAASAGFMISQFVTVNETTQEIAVLEKNLAAAEAVTSQMVFDMEQTVDLEEVEKQATTKLGMQRPEKHQIIYVNVKQEDKTEKTAGEVEGFANGTVTIIKRALSHIVNFFSIQ